MTIDNCLTTEDAVTQLLKLRQYAPFKYSGKWFVSAWGNTGRCYRSLSSLKKAMKREEIYSASLTIIE